MRPGSCRVCVLSLVILLNCWLDDGAELAAQTINVVVWDEQQPEQKQAYKNFLGHHIAEHLRKSADMSVTTATLSDPDKGLSRQTIDNCDVLIFWDHRKHREISRAQARVLVRRIERGELSMITLHSAHWSTPFIEAMNARTAHDALAGLAEEERATARFNFIHPKFYIPPKRGAILGPRIEYRKLPDRTTTVNVELGNCCFPGYRADGKPSTLFTLEPDHPIARGIPRRVVLPQTEMYDEPFHVPEPDVVVFEERWPTGEWFRSGCIWNLGRGKVFYFRPGHETFPVFHQPEMLTILENAVRYLAEEQRAADSSS